MCLKFAFRSLLPVVASTGSSPLPSKNYAEVFRSDVLFLRGQSHFHLTQSFSSCNVCMCLKSISGPKQDYQNNVHNKCPFLSGNKVRRSSGENEFQLFMLLTRNLTVYPLCEHASFVSDFLIDEFVE